MEIKGDLVSKDSLEEKVISNSETEAQDVPIAKQSSLFAPTASFALKHALNNEIASTKDTKLQTSKGLTVPVGPKLRANERVTSRHSTVLPQEDRELQEISLAKAAEMRRVDMNRKAYERLKVAANIAAKVASTVRSTKQLTVPETPIHNLMKRLGNKGANEVNNTSLSASAKLEIKKNLNFSGQLTQPQPFKFATAARLGETIFRCNQSVSDSSLTAAELMAKFHSDARSHYVPATHVKLTQPEAPKFETEKRALASCHEPVMSTEMREKQEMENFAKNPFKAVPILSSKDGAIGIHPVAPRPLTTTQPFTLATEKRSAVRNSISAPEAKEEVQSVFTFKAKPMPDFNAAEKPASYQYHPTIPVSPKFQKLHNRSSSVPPRDEMHSMEKKDNMHCKISGELMKSSWSNNKPLVLCTPKPFNLRTAERGEVYKEMLLQKIQAEKLMEKKMHSSIIAQPVRSAFKAVQPATPMPKLVTVPQEFQLLSCAKHACALEKQKVKLAEDERNIHKMAEFSAKPCPTKILQGPSFTFKKPSEVTSLIANGKIDDVLEIDGSLIHNPVVPLVVNLHTEERATKRTEFEKVNTERLQSLAEKKATELKEKADQEAKDLCALRRKSISEGGLCFKAKTVNFFAKTPAKALFPSSCAENTSPVTVTPANKENAGISSSNVINFLASKPKMLKSVPVAPGTPRSRTPKKTPVKSRSDKTPLKIIDANTIDVIESLPDADATEEPQEAVFLMETHASVVSVCAPVIEAM